MENDPNEVLKEIAAMQGMSVEEETPPEDRSVDDVEERKEVEGEREGEAGGEEAKVEEPEGDKEAEEETLDVRYSRLLEEHNALAAQLLDLQQRGYSVGGQPSTVEAPATPPVVGLPSSSPPQASGFQLDEALLERALVEDDPKAMKQVILGLVQHVETLTQQSREQTRETILRDIPSVATAVARQQYSMMTTIKDFYTDNKDLVPYQHVVGAVANEVAAKEPSLSIVDALNKTAVEVRRRLGLKKAAITQPDRQPAFPRGGKGGSRKPGAPVLTGLKAEIAAMQNAKY